MRILLLTLAVTIAQAPPPASEIYLLTLKADGDAVRLGEPINISNNQGYDNQPCFTPDGRSILFTSNRSRVVSTPLAGAEPPPSQTDIYRFDIASKQIRQVTDTLESEYSPTITPDGQGISVIRVEGDGTQRLWRFGLDGAAPVLVLTDVKPVGYHAWIDRHRLALFILGDRGQPATLQLADTRTGQAEVIATDIGRSIQRMPSGAISFVQREAAGEGDARRLLVRQFDPGAAGEARVSALVTVPPGISQPDLAWMPDGSLLLAHDGKLHRWAGAAAGWNVAADLAALGVRGASRLAVSPAGDWLAIVADGR
ncbi:hypothetical protein BH23ACI1_BH23ACI1_12290 [soil metagenome]